ncbi:hypothetical protein Ndes2526B_g04440 [Nannochloris sp. 'desiccata']|nr:hypothetical protein KSW81_000812 [Chlorella desiccata (nom. nud.)]KAH7620519.1 putative CBS domain-containing protein CBSX3, mitochondrial [Chlorella desiccata (nom. nud.)]
MALRKAIAQLSRSVAPHGTSRVLGVAPRMFGSSASLYNSAADPVSPGEGAADADPETVGWGSTTVGTLLRAKSNDSGAWLWCSEDDLVIDAIRKMTHANVGSLLVFDPSKVKVHERNAASHSKDTVVGIITERDYLTKVVVKGRQSTNTKVSEIMTPATNLLTVSPQHSVLDVMELMVEKNFRHVPVVEEGSMTGMVSIRDVVHVMVKEHREEVGRLNEYIQGTF